MSVLEEIGSRGHEKLTIFQEGALTAIVAIHNTTIGPSLGGCRMRPYPTLDDALLDVLKLSEAMSYKNALCGIGFGGGKSVIVADRNLRKGREDLFRTFGRAVDSLAGRYITAEDMGTTVSDMEAIAKETRYVAGTDPARGGAGDPSPYTALGVFSGMKACLESIYGSVDFQGKKVAIQGVGSVGQQLLPLLLKAGASVVVSDTRSEVLSELEGVEVVAPEAIHRATCDIYSPCAVGGAISADVVPELQCKAIAGGANNQLASPELEVELKKKGILYAPDFAINAGGVIMCADEFEPGGFQDKRVRARVENIQQTIATIFKRASENNKLSGEVALTMAKERISQAAA